MFNIRRSIGKIALVGLLCLAVAPASFGSTYLYTWDASAMAAALQDVNFGTACTSGDALSDCAVYSVFLTPRLTPDTATIIGSFASSTAWAAADLTSYVRFDAADLSPAAPVRFLTTNSNLGGVFSYTSFLSGGDITRTVAGPLVMTGLFGVYLSFDDNASPGTTLWWDGYASAVGLNVDGSQRQFGELGKDVLGTFELASQTYEDVPEPGSITLLGLGLAGMYIGFRGRRR